MASYEHLLKSKLLTSGQLAKLHTFEVVSRCGSFVIAADELALTPSAVSYRISSLEQELGFSLFERMHKKIKLTEEGKRIYYALKNALGFINQELLEIKNKETTGPLTIYARPSITQCWLVPKIADFHRRWPFIELTIITGNEQVNFRGYGIDVALLYDEHHPADLVCTDLMDDSIIPVCSPQYAEMNLLYGNPENLLYCTLLHDQQAWSSHTHYAEWETWLQKQNMPALTAARNIGFERSDLALKAAICGIGVAMGRKRLIQEPLKNRELVIPFPGTECSCKQRYYAAYLKSNLNPKVSLFINWLKEQSHS